jgi:hypothetical protein
MEDALMWGTMLGDAVHNFRSALDHLVWQLILLNTGKDGTTENQFPIASTGAQYWSKGKNDSPSLRSRRLKGVSEKHRIMIDRVQPYRTNEPGKIESLEALRDLSNYDKHRLLHTVLFVVDIRDEDKFGFFANDDAGERVDAKLEPFSEGGDTEIMVVEYTCPGPNPHVYTEGELPIGIGISELRIRLPQIPKIGESVGNIIESFGPDFP